MPREKITIPVLKPDEKPVFKMWLYGRKRATKFSRAKTKIEIEILK